ncbi:MAG TPA: serine/threonine-protein kinase, partial [Planctomicrobium sp.]|nr:serine/threonine-protein kinase [Planctomicrobium sp.]
MSRQCWEPSVLGTVDDLILRLSDLKLATSREMQRTLSELPAGASASDLLRRLEQQDIVTSLQATKIARGEADQLIVGGYKVMYQNASGSFARLYRGARLDNGQMVGIKILRDRWSKDPTSVQMFLREGELGKRFKHPNIVPIYDVGSTKKSHYIIMEFVEGGSLRDFLKIRGKLAPVEALQYTLHISRALEAALALGATHRDMRTSNVLMSSQGVAKLIDFGLASESSPGGNDDLAQALEYSTLESNTNAPRNDPRSDLFFLGAILYELLTGEPPYPRTKNRAERKLFSRYRDIRPVSSIDATLPPVVTAVVDRLLAVNPQQRYQSPTAVIADLEAALTTLGHA